VTLPLLNPGDDVPSDPDAMTARVPAADRIPEPADPSGSVPMTPARPAAAASVTRTASRVFGWVVVAAVANVFVAATTARTLSVGGRGEVVLLLTISGVTATLCGAGTNTSARYYLGRNDPRVTVRHYVGLSLVLAVPQCLLTPAIVAPTLGATGAPARGVGTVLLTAALATTTLLSIQFLDALNAVGLLATSSVVNAVGSGLQLTLLAVLVVLSTAHHHATSVVAVLAVFAAAGAAQVAMAFVMLARSGAGVVPQLDRRANRLLVTAGLPALGLNVGTSLTFRLDRYLLGLFGGVAAVGVYSVAATASESLRLVPSSWGQVVFHRIATGALTPLKVRVDTFRVLAAMAVLAALAGVGAEWFIELFFGAAYQGAVTPLRILLLAELTLVTFQIDARVLAGLGRTRACGAAGLIGLVTVAVLDLLLIPLFGLEGAAWATLVAYGAMTGWARLAVSVHRTSRRSARADASRRPATVVRVAGPVPLPRETESPVKPRSSKPDHTIILQPNRYGGRLAFYSQSPDPAHWDDLWASHVPSYRRSRRGHLPYHLRETFLRWAPPAGKVLEAGCGLAHFTVAARSRGYDAEALDWAPETVRRLRSLLPDVPLHLGDTRTLDIPDETYDAVYSPGVCEHFEEGPAAVLAATYRVLRPGGVAIVSTPCYNRYLQRRPQLFAPRTGTERHSNAENGGDVFYQYAFTPQEMTHLLRGAGFDVLATRPYGALTTLTLWSRPAFRRIPAPLVRPIAYAMDHAPILRGYGFGCVWVARRPVNGGESIDDRSRRSAP
jgi:O-antigen/teichoic acid export membrane protein/SAM-dependent methyltransferase